MGSMQQQNPNKIGMITTSRNGKSLFQPARLGKMEERATRTIRESPNCSNLQQKLTIKIKLVLNVESFPADFFSSGHFCGHWLSSGCSEQGCPWGVVARAVNLEVTAEPILYFSCFSKPLKKKYLMKLLGYALVSKATLLANS